ncbi:hypothetical protein HYV87_05570 [Candidatus Woesearchaeota archaeon]|nr:hypothetical protein [Candidatus Woesearchaeota archaeon]
MSEPSTLNLPSLPLIPKDHPSYIPRLEEGLQAAFEAYNNARTLIRSADERYASSALDKLQKMEGIEVDPKFLEKVMKNEKPKLEITDPAIERTLTRFLYQQNQAWRGEVEPLQQNELEAAYTIEDFSNALWDLHQATTLGNFDPQEPVFGIYIVGGKQAVYEGNFSLRKVKKEVGIAGAVKLNERLDPFMFWELPQEKIEEWHYQRRIAANTVLIKVPTAVLGLEYLAARSFESVIEIYKAKLTPSK